MNEHYIVTVDRGQLRIYVEAPAVGQRTPRLEVVETMDFPRRDESVVTIAPDASEQSAPTRSPPMGADRLPLPRRLFRRSRDIIAAELDTFLQNRPQASWDMAAAPALYHFIIDRLSPETRRRLKRALSKVMVNLRADEVLAQFAAVG